MARDLTSAFAGSRVRVSSPQGRFSVEAERLDGARFLEAVAVGKHLSCRFEVPEPAWVHIHLGLVGKFRIGDSLQPDQAVRFRIEADDLAAELRGPQWCRAITDAQWQAVVAGSGPDPLRPEADPSRGWERIHRSQKPVAALLMDQRVAAGVGNIFRAEVLFRLGLCPELPGREVTQEEWQRIWEELKELMSYALRTGRIDSVLPQHSPEAQQRPPRDDPHGGEVYVYRRANQPCLVCGTPIATRPLEGRHLYWCPTCQPT